MLHTILIPFLFLTLATSGQPADATGSDVSKERRWAEQVIEGLLDGEELWLIDDGGHEFLGILTRPDAKSERAVLLIHGMGVHPNWPDVIYPLREGLLEHGTTTLSLQMPILANDAEPREYGSLFPEVPGRIKAALDYLDNEGHKKVVIVAHSMGASMALYYLSRNQTSAVRSIVVIGMGPGITESENITALEKVDVPILDIYGGDDLEPVLESIGRRVMAGIKSGGLYKQVRVAGANHFFQGHEAELLRRVIEWLEAK